MGIADHLRRFLSEKGWKAADLERATGLKHSSLFEVLDGKTENPRYEFIQRIVRNTDIDPDFLLSGEGDPIRRGPIEASPATRKDLRHELGRLVEHIDQRHKELQGFHQEVKTDLEKLAVLLGHAGLRSKPKSGRDKS